MFLELCITMYAITMCHTLWLVCPSWNMELNVLHDMKFLFCHIILEEGSVLQQNLNSCNNMITKPFSLPHLQYNISYLNDTKQVWYMKLWSVGQCHQLEIFSKWSLTHYDWFATSQPICTGALYYIIVFWFISCHHNLHEDKGFID